MGHPDALRFNNLTQYQGVAHGVFLRAGGESRNAFSGLNIGLACGDEPDVVARNRAAMLAALGLTRGVFLDQVHGDDILILKHGETDIRPLVWDTAVRKTQKPVRADGVVSNINKLGLVIQTADCQAIVLYDPVAGVAGNVHSGWRGSVFDVAGKCVGVMVDAFGCRPENIIAGISPSLGPCCAEFINYKKELPESMWPYRIGQSDYFDFWKLTVDQLAEQGVLPSNIKAMQLCTRCNPDQFYSYRGQGATGRFGTVIALNNCVKKGGSEK